MKMKRQPQAKTTIRGALTKRQRATFGDSEQPVEPQLARSFKAWLKESEVAERMVIRSITGRLK